MWHPIRQETIQDGVMLHMLLDPDGWVYSMLCPEMKRLESEHDRREAIRQTKRAIATSKRFWAAFALFVVLALAGFKMLGWLSAPGTTVRNGVIYTTVVPIAYILLFSRLYGQTIRQSVRRQLVRNGIPVCIFCGYDLRASKDRCPECGEGIDG